jgi:phosphate uptake regulator
MLKNIRALWKDGSIMHEAIERLGQMVEDAEYVYTHAWDVCTGQAVAEKSKEAIREHDKAVNRNERHIRRLLAEHLTINPEGDVSGCLAVMIMAKDLERLGDHGRNIFNLNARLEGGVSGFKLFPELDGVRKHIAGMFPVLQRAIVESREEIAHEVLKTYQEVKQEVKRLQGSLFDADLAGREAVVTTLLVRYFMRINAHIGNAASGVIFPLENIDFVSRGLREEEKDR